jgi:hypothetical protein
VLDADDNPLVYNGQEMERDIVQFVPFREFRNNPHQLAEETLKVGHDTHRDTTRTTRSTTRTARRTPLTAACCGRYRRSRGS